MLLGVREFSLKCYELLIRVSEITIRYCDTLSKENEFHNGANAVLISVKELIYKCCDLLISLFELLF